MYIDKIREVFERHNYKPNSQINQQNFYQFLSQLTVTPTSFSQDSPTIEMSPISSGNRPLAAQATSKSTASARPSTTASTYSKSNSTKSMVCSPSCRRNQVA